MTTIATHARPASGGISGLRAELYLNSLIEDARLLIRAARMELDGVHDWGGDDDPVTDTAKRLVRWAEQRH